MTSSWALVYFACQRFSGNPQQRPVLQSHVRAFRGLCQPLPSAHAFPPGPSEGTEPTWCSSLHSFPAAPTTTESAWSSADPRGGVATQAGSRARGGQTMCLSDWPAQTSLVSTTFKTRGDHHARGPTFSIKLASWSPRWLLTESGPYQQQDTAWIGGQGVGKGWGLLRVLGAPEALRV